MNFIKKRAIIYVECYFESAKSLGINKIEILQIALVYLLSKINNIHSKVKKKLCGGRIQLLRSYK